VAREDRGSDEELRLRIGERAGEVSALLRLPPGSKTMYVLAHGAGAGMRQPFLDAVVERLAERSIATLRYQFPYIEQGSRRPDPRPVLLATVAAAIELARERAPGLKLVAGGKSMGGRMTSHLLAATPPEDVAGLVFLGFPLHPAGKPSTERADHLASVRVPMLFLQGTRDPLADLGLVGDVCGRLGPLATLHVVDDADHSFHVRKRSGRTDDAVLDELADAVARFVE